jgi:ubiquinone/menaquinone biosynthesis C-methylase UbiE
MGIPFVRAKSEIASWMGKDGELFLRDMGLKRGQCIFDYGCGEGHYAIPAAGVVGADGTVYAFDKEKDALDNLRKTAKEYGKGNIKIIHGNVAIPLKNRSIDLILCYDVLHYEKNRKAIYSESHRVLKDKGIFSVYPKHRKDDYPLMELADLELEDIQKEIEESGFLLVQKVHNELLHDDYYTRGWILNFRKKS